MTFLLLVGIGATLAVFIPLVRYWMGYQQQQAQSTGAIGQQSAQTSQPWLTAQMQSLLVGLLLVSILWLLFPQEMILLFKNRLREAGAIAAAVTILSLLGSPQQLLRIGRLAATGVLIVLLSMRVFWPVAEKELAIRKVSMPASATASPSGQTSVVSTGIILKPGQEIYASKSQADLPAPAWIVKAKDGNNRRIPWSDQDVARKLKNDHPSDIEVLLELPPGLQENHLAWRRW